MNSQDIYQSVNDLFKGRMENATQEGDVPSQLVERWVPSTCGYCAVGCRLLLGVCNKEIVSVKGDVNSSVNNGKLCIKGRYQWKALSVGRATVPMIRKGGILEPATWDEALNLIAEKIQETIREQGPEGVAIYSSGFLTLEEQYAIGKLARGYLGTPNMDANTRLCMASTVEGYIRSFGQDGPPGCYEDLDLADTLLLFGCNPAEMHPNLWLRMKENQARRGCYLIVVDPRLTATAASADCHLSIRPGSNAAFLQGIIYVVLREGLIDEEFVREHTEGLQELVRSVEDATPEVTALKTGISAEEIVACARRFAESKATTSVFAQGVNQSVQGTEVVNLLCNLHLLTGKIGKPGSTSLSLTGQAAAMSNREVGGGATFVGYREWNRPEHRAEVARLWGIPEERLPRETRDITQILRGIEAGTVKVLWNVATNSAVSLPNQARTRQQFEKAFFVVQDVYYPVETAAFADVFLPAAQWAEKTGTLTNAERRVSLARKAINPPGEAKTDLWIIQEVAKRLGFGEGFRWVNAESVFEEWKRLSRGRPVDMSGITYKRLEKENGLQWPCPSANHPGSTRLYADRVFATESKKARLWGVQDIKVPQAMNYPFVLNTGRIREHFHSRTKTKRIAELALLSSEGYVEIAVKDALMLGIDSDHWVKVTTPQGWISVKAKISAEVPPGTVFIPIHFGDLNPEEEHFQQAANHLTGGSIDPISMQPHLKFEYCRVEKE